jgi:hypothetical protein
VIGLAIRFPKSGSTGAMVVDQATHCRSGGRASFTAAEDAVQNVTTE